MVEILQVDQTKDLGNLVLQLNALLRRISQLLGVTTAAGASAAAGLTESRVTEMIRQHLSNYDLGDLGNYAFMPGRDSGQSLSGGKASGENLTLQSNAADPKTGLIRLDSPTSLYDLGEDADGISGLTWAWVGGTLRQGTSVVTVASGSLTLSAATTSYIEVNPATGSVTTNTTGFTPDRIPLRQVATSTAEQISSIDKRAWITERAPVRGAFVWTVGSTVGTGLNASHQLRCTVPDGVVPESCTLDVKTAPTGQSLICDIKSGGVSLFSSAARPTVVSSATTGSTATFSTALILSDTLLTFDVAQVGSTVSGADLTATLKVRQRR